jgi:4-amino-4-deoxy-L-arabinose transferase-like glycosyltransferase
MMRASSLTLLSREGLKRWWPEAMTGMLASVIFLASLGSVEMWGKREQRASLEAVDTLDHQHWLVARIQGHPRLEKPPLSRWAIASMIALTGRRDEAVIRLPAALSALALVGLVYGLGCRLEGRAVGLASSLILCSTAFFIAEMRQAGNDSLLALFTTLALYAAWRRLDSGSRAWSRVMYVALGLGFIAKGPIILMLVGVAVIPYLLITGRLRTGLPTLIDGWGLLIFLAFGLSWPILVILDDPHAIGVWSLEMGQKTGLNQLMEHRKHSWLAKEWPGMLFPWSLIAVMAVALPFLPQSPLKDGEPQTRRTSPFWFPWCWAIGNLAIFCLWRVAKPSYYLPCLPGMAILLGSAWIRLVKAARLPRKAGATARQLLQLHWVMLFAGAGIVPLVARSFVVSSVWPWTVVLAAVVAGSVVVSAFLWRRGADDMSLAPLTFASAIIVMIGYGIIAPVENVDRGHRELAREVARIVSPGDAKLRFLQELDEGLSFYLPEFQMEPIPGSGRRYNAAYDFVDDYRNQRREHLTRGQVEAQVPERLKRSLIKWLDRSGANSDYLLIPTRFYDRFVAELAPRTTPLLREDNKKRNELMLLRVGHAQAAPVASAPDGSATTRR